MTGSAVTTQVAVEQQQFVDRINPRVARLVTIFGFTIPVVMYVWLFEHYSVNIVIGDQWDDVNVIRASYHQFIPWHALWVQHNENRMFFPNLLVIALAKLTHFNMQVEEALGIVFLFLAVALLIWAHRRRTPGLPLLYYCPVAFVMLTLAQFGNTLWGFQVAWFMILLALVVAMVLLDGMALTWGAFLAAVAAAFVGSLSSSQGLLIWTAGLVLLYHRRRSWVFVVAWIASAVVTAAIYFHNFNFSLGSAYPGFASSYPVDALKFYVFAIGDVLGLQMSYGEPGNNAILLFGLVLVVLAVGCILIYGIRRDSESGGPLGLSLIMVGLLFAGLITKGRSAFGYWGAGASRYVTFDVLVLAGIYLTVLGRRYRPGEHSGPAQAPSSRSIGARLCRLVDGLPRWGDRVALRWLGALAVAAIALQFVFSVSYGIRGARHNYVYQAQGVPVLRNYETYPDGPLAYHLYIFSNGTYIRAQASTLKAHHLSIFANGAIWP